MSRSVGLAAGEDFSNKSAPNLSAGQASRCILLAGTNRGVAPIDDDELDEVVGRIRKEEAQAAKDAASKEGRTLCVGAFHKACLRHIGKYQYAKMAGTQGYYMIYYNVKCYKPGCGKTKRET